MTQSNHYDVASLADPKIRLSNRIFMIEGMEIHSQFMPATLPTDTLIVRFHGAIQRASRALPAFQANLAEISPYGHQLTICDPTMMTRDGFSLGWYAGHDSLDVQGILCRFFAQSAHVLGTRRHIYLGSSGGGFAALHYSYHHAESVAVVMGPQTSIAAHTPGAVRNYIDNCWPGRTLEDISGTVNVDMCTLYRSDHENTVIYIQSTGDFLHNSCHLAPFMRTIYRRSDNVREDRKFLLVSDYWGRPGHGGAIPHDAYIPWLRAALAAQSGDGEDILAAYAPADSKPVVRPAASIVRCSDPDALFDADRLKLADQLRDYHLRRTEMG